MRKLDPPAATASASFELCLKSVRSKKLRKRLKKVQPHVEARAAAFQTAAAAAGLHLVPRYTVVGAVAAAEMAAVYERMVKGKGRPIYDRILAMAPNATCPLCGQRDVGTLDHHLPKMEYSALAVVPINLIPACPKCNHLKGEYFPTIEEEQLLHPYFDDVTGERWLEAQVQATVPASVVYTVSNIAAWGPTLMSRIQFQFDRLQLRKLYGAHSAREIAETRLHLSRLYEAGGPDQVREHLEDQAASREGVHLNSWQAALYRALAASPWYYGGGFRPT